MEDDRKVMGTVIDFLERYGKKKSTSSKRRSTDTINNKSSISQTVTGDHNILAGRDVFVNTRPPKPRITVVSTEDHIDSAQQFEIKRLIDVLVEMEMATGNRPSAQALYAAWWSKFKRRFKVPKYSLLPKDRYEEAIVWLRQQGGMLRPRLRRSNNQVWRKVHYKGIWARARQLGLSNDDVHEIASALAGKKISSLTELGERLLKRLYQNLYSR